MSAMTFLLLISLKFDRTSLGTETFLPKKKKKIESVSAVYEVGDKPLPCEIMENLSEWELFVQHFETIPI